MKYLLIIAIFLILIHLALTTKPRDVVRSCGYMGDGFIRGGALFAVLQGGLRGRKVRLPGSGPQVSFEDLEKAEAIQRAAFWARVKAVARAIGLGICLLPFAVMLAWAVWNAVLGPSAK